MSKKRIVLVLMCLMLIFGTITTVYGDVTPCAKKIIKSTTVKNPTKKSGKRWIKTSATIKTNYTCNNSITFTVQYKKNGKWVKAKHANPNYISGSEASCKSFTHSTGWVKGLKKGKTYRFKVDFTAKRLSDKKIAKKTKYSGSIKIK